MKSILLSSQENSNSIDFIETGDLSDKSIPLLLFYDMIFVDLVESMDLSSELIEELRLSIELGTTTIFLVSDCSNLSVIQQLANIEGTKARQAGTRFQIEPSTPLKHIKSLISSYSAYFRGNSNWYSLAYLKDSNIMIAGFSAVDSGLVGVFPRPSKLSESFLQSLSDLISWWKRKRSPLKQVKLFIAAWCMFFIAVSLITSYLRYSQREENIQIQNKDWLQSYEASVERWHVDSHALSAMLTSYRPFPVPYTDEGLQSTYGISTTSLNIAKELGRQGLVNKLAVKLAANDVWEAIFWLKEDMIELMRWGYYRRAEHRAKQIIDLAQRHRFEDDQFLQKIRHARELISKNFLQSTQGVSWADIIENRYQARRQLDIETSDPSLEDNISYYKIAAAYVSPTGNDDSFFQDRRTLWKKFISQYPGSEKVDEAAFNIILLDTHLVGIQEKNSQKSKAMLTQLDGDSRELISQYPKSYLADDTLFYLAIFSAEHKKISACVSALTKLFRDYKDSDHAIRLSGSPEYKSAVKGSNDNPASHVCNNKNFQDWRFRI